MHPPGHENLYSTSKQNIKRTILQSPKISSHQQKLSKITVLPNYGFSGNISTPYLH